jgi:hypothetical protein
MTATITTATPMSTTLSKLLQLKCKLESPTAAAVESSISSSVEVLIKPQDIGIFDLSIYNTAQVQTTFKVISDCPCFVPKYYDEKIHKFTLCSPLYHEERKKLTHEWLCKLGTYKYLDILEEVAIYAKRLEQYSEGKYPLISSLPDIPNPLQMVEQERSEKSCPLLLRRSLGNGLYVLVNVNDMERFPLDFNPLSI